MSFVDASVIVAIIGREDDWEMWSDRLDALGQRIWSPMARWESVAGLRLRLKRPVEEVRQIVTTFARENDFVTVSIGDREGDIAMDAYQRYGKGSGHPAQLNMGDCFAYACATTHAAALLYKGNDFAHTDLR